jgi:hypothetical protein
VDPSFDNGHDGVIGCAGVVPDRTRQQQSSMVALGRDFKTVALIVFTFVRRPFFFVPKWN